MGKDLDKIGFELVKAGMSASEVERLLGGPPGLYGDLDIDGVRVSGDGAQPFGRVVRTWADTEVLFEVHFDIEGKVVEKYRRDAYSPVPMYPPE